MTSPWFSLFALIWLFLHSIHLIKGREILKETGLIVTRQNISSLYLNISPQITPQMTSKVATTAQTIMQHWAIVRFYPGQYYGIQASLNVYGLPAVKNGQVSSMRIWVMSTIMGFRESYHAIQAGWRVHPDRYGDHDTHFYVLWTVDQDYKTGCLDLDCKGFVLYNASKLVPGYRLQPLSEYNGVQRFITLKISKDDATGDWWLHYGSDGTKPVGYWPKSLFTNSANSASDIHMGGMATFAKGGVSPPMGSGHDASEGEGKAASIKNTRLIDKNGYLHTPSVSDYHYYFDNCYKIAGKVSSTLYVGGPGGCKN